MTADNPVRCLENKLAMVGYKGGRCMDCRKPVTREAIQNFHFDHLAPIGNSNDQTNRWNGAVRSWAPFTERWFAWAETVDLVCAACHQIRHHGGPRQLSLLELQEVQERLNGYDHGEPLTTQSVLI